MIRPLNYNIFKEEVSVVEVDTDFSEIQEDHMRII